MKKLALILLIPSLSLAEVIPKELQVKLDTACKLMSQNDPSILDLCLSSMRIVYKAGYKTAIEDSKK